MAETRAPRPLWRRRWLWIVLAILVALRAALPEVLRRVAVSQASTALTAQVNVGDVDLALHRGGVTLENVALRAPTDAPDAAPLIAWDRFTVELRYLPLFRKTVQLRSVVLDAPSLKQPRCCTPPTRAPTARADRRRRGRSRR